MESLLSQSVMQIDENDRAYRAGADKWTGCDWTTAFGKMDINLNGLKASQALLLARATSGNEQVHWRAAAKWLADIEQEAKEAQELSKKALTLARAGRISDALSHVQRACAIEAKHHTRLVWQPLLTVIEAAVNFHSEE